MPSDPPAHAMSEVEARCDAIEECYEFMLGFAGKGLPTDEGSQVRSYLQRAVNALDGLAQGFAEIIEKQRIEPGRAYQAFLQVLERDAADSLAALNLVLAQPSISSQLIDNLNASIHLRALLTGIFLIDGALNERLKKNPVTAE
jgi:hypothetical protein